MTDNKVRATIAGKPLQCRHCAADVFRYEDTRLDAARVRGLNGPEGPWGLFTSTYICVGCGCVHLFAEADRARHVRTGTDADTERVECMSCEARIPAGAQQCPACGWSWTTESSDIPVGESL